MKIRCAILTAVSTPEQAEDDKVSLEHQLTVCRSVVQANGWVETDGPFVVDGYSRSSYVNLSDAERDIPKLGAAMESARSNRYDLLVLFSYDRLGDLTILIAGDFRNYKKQLYSVSQPTIVQDPLTYNPYFNDSADIQQLVSRIVQRFRINDLRRKWHAGMPSRIEKGLTASRINFGYRWVSRKEPPIQVDSQIALIIQMKDLFFEGKSLSQIARECDRSGVPSPDKRKHWHRRTVQRILVSPYYMGKVFFRKTVGVFDPALKKKRRYVAQPKSQWVLGDGKHQPIWDEETHNAIVFEMDRRVKAHQFFASRFALSGLCVCSECDQKLNRRTQSKGRLTVLTCRLPPTHVRIPYDDALHKIADALQFALIQNAPLPKEQRDASAERVRAAIAEQTKRRKKVQDGYEAGLYTPPEAAKKLSEIDVAIESFQSQLDRITRDVELTSQIRQSLAAQDLSRLAEWMKKGDPAMVNRLLSSLCEKIIITPNDQIQLVFR